MSTQTPSTKKPLSDKLITKLSEGLVTFQFRKLDGTIRYAAGTHNPALMPVEKQPKDLTKSHVTATNISYYDFLKKDWRSLKKDSVVRINSTVKP